jgi:hypothetical protein
MSRHLIIIAMAAVLTAPSFAVAPAHASPAAETTQQIENLKQTLEQVLRARRQEEFDFIAKVVGLVDDGTLPRSMVESTLFWVRKKNPKRPFQYFEQALRVRAKAIGVEL